jgi:hypothetical protein
MRYIRDNLVIRVHNKITDELLAQLNARFSDILVSGVISRVETHPYEHEEEHLRELPRIGLHFNRRDTSRLREMVDLINEIG